MKLLIFLLRNFYKNLHPYFFNQNIFIFLFFEYFLRIFFVFIFEQSSTIIKFQFLNDWFKILLIVSLIYSALLKLGNIISTLIFFLFYTPSRTFSYYVSNACFTFTFTWIVYIVFVIAKTIVI